MAFWGFSFVWVKVVYYYYQPLTTVFLRVSSAAIILLLIKVIFKIRLKPDKSDIKYLILLAFIEPFTYFLGESFGMKYVSSTLASVIISTIPVFSPLAAYLIAKEKISVLNFIGIIISFAGILIMVIEPDLSFKESPIGIALMMLAVMAAIFYTILINKLASKYKPLTLLTWQYMIGSLLFMPLFLIFELDNFLMVKPDFRLISTLILLIIFASILAFFFFIQVVEKIGINKANVFTNFVPIITAITAFYVLPEEKATVKVIIGILVALMGIFISQLKYKKFKY